MRILDKILYKTKLQTGGNLAGKVIKKEDGYFENPDGIANSPTIDRKNYTSIDKTKVNKGVYNYKGVDYLLDYIPTNMTSYGVSETYTKPAAPATTSTNTVPSNPKFMPKAHFSTNMALSPNKPLVLGINKDKGVFQRASVEAENNFPLTRGVTVQQSVSSSDMQPVSTPVTTTIPEKKKGLFNRIFGKRDNKLTTSDNATNITSTTNNTDTNSKTALPARANTSLSQVPVLGVPTNNSTSANTTSVFDPDKINTYTLDNMGNIVDENGNVISFKSNKEKKAASEMFRSSDKNVKKVSTISNIASTTPTSVATTQNPIQSTTTNSSIPVPAQQNPPLPVLGDKSDKVTTTLNKEEYSYNSHLPLGENIFEGKKYKYNGKTGNIIKSDGTVIQVDPRVKKRLDMVFNMPYTDGHAAFSLEEQELALNEAGDANGVYKEGNFVSGEDYGKNETTNNPTPVPGLTLPPNISAATSSQTEYRLPVIDTKAPIKPKPIYSAQQPANVQPEVSTQSSQNINTPAKNKDVAKSRNISGKLAIPDVTQEETATLRDQHRILNNDPENSPRIMSSQTPNEIYNDYSVPGHYRVQNVISKIGESPLINDMKVWDETQKMLVFFRDLPIAVQKRYIESAKTNITNNNNSTANYEPLNRNNPNPKESVYNKDYYTMENFNAMNADNYKRQTANAAALIGKEDRDAFYNKSTKDRENVLQKEADIVAMYEYAVPAPGYERDKGLGFYNLNSQTDPVSHYKIDPKKVPKGYNIDIEKVYTNAEIAAALAYHRSLREAYVHLHRDLPQRPTIFKNETKRRKEETEGTIKRQEREKVQDRKLIAKIRHIAEVAPEENRLSEEQEKEFNENYDKKLKEDEKRKKEYRKKQGLKNQSGGYINKTKYRFI